MCPCHNGSLQQVATHVGFLPDKTLKAFFSLTGINSNLLLARYIYEQLYYGKTTKKSELNGFYSKTYINFKIFHTVFQFTTQMNLYGTCSDTDEGVM